MEFYPAGNFVLMSDPKKEQQFVEEMRKRENNCNRLISFFFKKELATVMHVQQLKRSNDGKETNSKSD